MSSQYKEQRKQMAEPDKFLQASNDYMNQVAANKKPIVGVAAGVLAVIIAVLVISSISDSKCKAAGEAMANAMALVSRPVSADGFAAGSKAFVSEKEKYEKIAEAFRNVVKEHEGTKAGISANYYLADALYHLGSYDEAVKSYNAYITGAGDKGSMVYQAREGLAYASEAKGDAAAAEKSFNALADSTSDENAKARAKFHAARMMAVQGRYQESADAMDRIVTDFPRAYSVVASAKERLAILASQNGVRPAAKAETKADGK